MEDRAPASPAGSASATMSAAAQRRVASVRRLAVLYGALLLVGGLALGLVTGAVSAATTPLGRVDGQAVTEAGRGGDLYLTSCAACHGVQGAGTAKGPDIRNAGAALADFMLRTGRMPLADPGAPPQRGNPSFSDADRQALVAYVASFGQGPAIPDVVTSGADIRAGLELFTSNCAACHGPAGGGGAVGGGFVAPALTQADATTVGEAVITGPGPMPRFSFSPDQLNSLAAYVAYLRNAPHPGGATSPEVGPVTEGFIAGMTLLGLLLVARWVGLRRDTASELLAEPGTGGVSGGHGAGVAARGTHGTPATTAERQTALDPGDDRGGGQA
jgi:ubiquinol-cytochrome c reductase cytochrome c subunit